MKRIKNESLDEVIDFTGETNGEILCNQWFDWCYDFSEGFARVILGKKCNYIDTNGEILSDQWFESCTNFYNGVASVLLNNKLKEINTNGEILNK